MTILITIATIWLLACTVATIGMSRALRVHKARTPYCDRKEEKKCHTITLR